MPALSKLAPRLLAVGLILGTAACATRPPDSEPEALAEYLEANDPLEPTNRVLFSIHQGIDQAVLRPLAVGYREVVPAPVRSGVRNALGNLRSPVIAINDVLQGDPERFYTTLARFMINSTFGLAGIFDIAGDHMGLRGHSADFGQTVGAAGVGEGPYLFIPLLGPSNPRDLTGFGADIAANPFTYLTFGSDGLNYTWDYGRPVIGGIDAREGLIEPIDQVNQTSLDPYATIRSAYRQQRRRLIQQARESGSPNRAPAADPSAFGTGFGTGNQPR